MPGGFLPDLVRHRLRPVTETRDGLSERGALGVVDEVAAAVAGQQSPSPGRISYQTSTEAYSKAVSELVSKIGVTAKAEYEALNRAAEQARYVSMDPRDRLERHTAERGC